MAIVSPGYFSTIGTPLLRGRDFTDLDDHHHPRVLIVNQAFADKFFPGQSPIGKRIESGATGPHDDGSPMREIVGIVGNARQSPMSLTPDPIYYMPFRQMPWGASIIVRADLPPRRWSRRFGRSPRAWTPRSRFTACARLMRCLQAAWRRRGCSCC